MNNTPDHSGQTPINPNANIFERIEFTWQDVTSSIAKDADLYSLTEAHKIWAATIDPTLRPENKRPGVWTANKTVDGFISRQKNRCRNSCIAFKQVKGGSRQGTWGNKRILQKYLEWLDPEYEDICLDAIEAIGSGDLRKVIAQSTNNNILESKVDELVEASLEKHVDKITAKLADKLIAAKPQSRRKKADHPNQPPLPIMTEVKLGPNDLRKGQIFFAGGVSREIITCHRDGRLTVTFGERIKTMTRQGLCSWIRKYNARLEPRNV